MHLQFTLHQLADVDWEYGEFLDYIFFLQYMYLFPRWSVDAERCSLRRDPDKRLCAPVVSILLKKITSPDI